MIDPITLVALASSTALRYMAKYAKDQLIDDAISGIVTTKADAIANKLIGTSLKKIRESERVQY